MFYCSVRRCPCTYPNDRSMISVNIEMNDRLGSMSHDSIHVYIEQNCHQTLPPNPRDQCSPLTYSSQRVNTGFFSVTRQLISHVRPYLLGKSFIANVITSAADSVRLYWPGDGLQTLFPSPCTSLPTDFVHGCADCVSTPKQSRLYGYAAPSARSDQIEHR